MMRMLILMLGLVLILAGGLTAVHAQEAESVQEAEPVMETGSINPEEITEPAAVISSGELVDEAFQEFARNKGISYGSQDSRGRIFYSAKATVSVHPDNAQWGKARTLAFEKALLAAQQQFVWDMFGKQITQQFRKYFYDQSDNADVFPEDAPTASKLIALKDKLVALLDAKVNEKLVDMGVDPEEYSAKPPPQRKKLLEEHLIKRCLNRAIGEISGLVPMQTYEGMDGKGTHTIGVILMYSPSLKQLAYDLSKNRVPLLSGQPKRSVRELVPADPETLCDQFGMRVLFDESGSPCIVSYGQWSHNYSGSSEQMRERKNQAALDAARDLADSYITVFQQANMRYTSERETGELIEEVLTKDSDDNITEENITQIIDRYNEEIKVTAKADMAGRGTLRTWKYKHPGGHEISGCVRIWTVQNLQKAKDVRNWKPGAGTSAAAPAGGGQAGPAALRGSQEDMDVEDF